MATQEQYEVYKSAYDEEWQRYSSLHARANLYLTVITAYIGAIAFKFKDVAEFSTAFKLPTFWLLISALLLLIALLCAVIGSSIRTYEGFFNPDVEIENLEEDEPTNEDFFDRRIADLVVAVGRNSRTNNDAAFWLKLASFLLFAAITVHATMLLYGFQLRQQSPSSQGTTENSIQPKEALTNGGRKEDTRKDQLQGKDEKAGEHSKELAPNGR